MLCGVAAHMPSRPPACKHSAASKTHTHTCVGACRHVYETGSRNTNVLYRVLSIEVDMESVVALVLISIR